MYVYNGPGEAKLNTFSAQPHLPETVQLLDCRASQSCLDVYYLNVTLYSLQNSQTNQKTGIRDDPIRHPGLGNA
jgi:hypothetical protein